MLRQAIWSNPGLCSSESHLAYSAGATTSKIAASKITRFLQKKRHLKAHRSGRHTPASFKL